jgi:hypothetical protein
MDIPRPPLIRLLTLVVFMLLGAAIGAATIGEWLLEATVGYDHGDGKSIIYTLVGAVSGALVGVLAELALQQCEGPKFQFRIHFLFTVMTLLSIILGLVLGALLTH